jgi:hypothetical protein
MVEEKQQNEESNNKMIPPPPPLVQSWLNVYHVLPKIYVPGTNLSISITLFGAMGLFTIRSIVQRILPLVFGWPSSNEVPTIEGASSFAAIVHSTILCTGLILAFSTHKYSPSERLDVAPLWWQELVDSLLQFCTGYMLYDGFFNVLVLRWTWGDLTPTFAFDDYLFLGHHMVTAWYMSSTRVIRAGHQSAMICMLLGELSNPLHNSYMMADVAMTLDCCNGPVGQQMHAVIEVLFAAVYNFIRVLVAPIFFVHLTYDICCTQQAKDNIPLGLRITWTVMVWAVVFGSFSWILKCHGILEKFVSQHITGGGGMGGAEDL